MIRTNPIRQKKQKNIANIIKIYARRIQKYLKSDITLSFLLWQRYQVGVSVDYLTNQVHGPWLQGMFFAIFLLFF